LLLMGGKKKSKKKSAPSGNGNGNGNGKVTCPPVVHVSTQSFAYEVIEKELEDDQGSFTMEVKIPKIAYNEGIAGNRDIIAITIATLEPVLPESCLSSESIQVMIMREPIEEGGTPDEVKVSAVEFFYFMGLDLIEDLYTLGIFSEEEAAKGTNDLNNWWVGHMGDAPLPEIRK